MRISDWSSDVCSSDLVETVRQLAARKVGSVVIFSAGFAEGGEEGLAQQREIARIASEHAMVIEGPNCLGCVNYIDGVPLTFVETEAKAPRCERSVAIVSQRGAMAAVRATMLPSRDTDGRYTRQCVVSGTRW